MIKPLAQYGALPYRRTPNLEILLVTSRDTGRWVIPKGWPMVRRTRRQTAAREAFEEAGVVGEIKRPALGAYDYWKFLKSGEGLPCRVTVFALEVRRQRARWPEQDQRAAQWFSSEAAAEAVQEPDLANLIRVFAERLAEAREAEIRAPIG